MSGAKIRWRRMRRRLRQYYRSNTFAIVTAPAALSAVAIWLGDVMDKPACALLVTVLIFVVLTLWFVFWPPYWRRGTARWASNSEAASADRLVLCMSTSRAETADEWAETSGQAAMLRAVNPKQIAIVGTAETSREVLHLKAKFGDLKVVEHTLLKDEAYDTYAAYDVVARAIRQLARRFKGQVAVDITGGTKPMSIGAYEAARDGGVAAIYLEQPPKKDSAVVLLEPAEMEET